MAGISINPALVSNAPGTFVVSSDGYVAGTALDAPANRNRLVSGINLSATPMYGGIAITANLTTGIVEGANPGSGYAPQLGPTLAFATAVANITGWTVFDQSLATYSSPQSPVPLASQYGAINYYETGSGARIVVPVSAADAATFQAGAVNQACYWNYSTQFLAASGTGALSVKIVDIQIGNSMVPSYNSGTGFATWSYTGSVAVIEI